MRAGCNMFLNDGAPNISNSSVCLLLSHLTIFFTFTPFPPSVPFLMLSLYYHIDDTFMKYVFSTHQVKKLNATVAEKKSSLAPVVKELRQLRQKCQVSHNVSRTCYTMDVS